MQKTLLLTLLLLIMFLSGCTQVSEEIEKTTGGVIICEADYPCGNSDNVCPQDYGADCKVEDPDCE